MTSIEQACHRRATELWRRRADLHDWRSRLFLQVLRYCELSGPRPTSSASIVLFSGIAAAGAEAYRKRAPTLSEWKNVLSLEPQVLNRKVSEIYARAENEIRLHQDIVARLIRIES
ncbi:hypothetical protein [Hyphomicrobium sp.]|jgi:hypothetical protein|uniref:hypothetical protein n=1 Tax=Hyphomicrobium sp. TaxID=82 RepID=UPI0035634CC3